MSLWRPWRCKQRQGEDLDAAHEQADRAIVDARQLRTRADKVVGELAATRLRNHFAAKVAETMRRNA